MQVSLALEQTTVRHFNLRGWPTELLYVGHCCDILYLSFNYLIDSFLSDRKFKILVEGEFSTRRKIAAGVPEVSFVATLLYSLYINGVPMEPEIHVALLGNDACIYVRENHERRVLCKLQHVLTAVKSLCQRRIIKINEGRNYVERTVVKALRTYKRTYSLFKIRPF
jgi:hypothetical protein